MTTEIDKIYKLDRRKLIKMGNSVGLTLHKDELKEIGGLDAGDTVKIIVDKDDKITIEPDG